MSDGNGTTLQYGEQHLYMVHIVSKPPIVDNLLEYMVGNETENGKVERGNEG